MSERLNNRFWQVYVTVDETIEREGSQVTDAETELIESALAVRKIRQMEKCLGEKAPRMVKNGARKRFEKALTAVENERVAPALAAVAEIGQAMNAAIERFRQSLQVEKG